MQEENFSPAESLKLIQSMIDKTKQGMSDKSIYYLVWGWITFIACTGQFILKHIYNYEKHYMVWWLVVVGIVFSVYYSIRDGKKSRVKTYIGDSMKYLWIGMGISYFVLSMILSEFGWDKMVFPFFMMLYGLGTFVSGGFIQFRPLITGGIIASALAIGAAYVDYDYQMLFGAAAILVSYIIPAYMLRNKIKYSNQ
ncbi:MAG: hypothetical protein Q8941_15820 [Bacteroidota bacterium]|nr:hypothetical protein [Bacteroidota bacterium]